MSLEIATESLRARREDKRAYFDGLYLSELMLKEQFLKDCDAEKALQIVNHECLNDEGTFGVIKNMVTVGLGWGKNYQTGIIVSAYSNSELHICNWVLKGAKNGVSFKDILDDVAKKSFSNHKRGGLVIETGNTNDLPTEAKKAIFLAVYAHIEMGNIVSSQV